MSRRWTDPRTARVARIPDRADSYGELGFPDGGDAGPALGVAESRYAAAGVIAVVSFAVGFSFGRHGRHR